MAGQLKAAPAFTEEVPPEYAGDVCGQDRPMRADARRNNEKIIAAAKKVFATVGGHASIEAIAKEAGVGVGTLYRHFPNRIDIVEAVYRNDVEVLVQAAESAVIELEPWPALVSWLNAFVEYSQGKRIFFDRVARGIRKKPKFEAELSGAHRLRDGACLRTGAEGRSSAARRERLGPDATDLFDVLECPSCGGGRRANAGSCHRRAQVEALRVVSTDHWTGPES